MASGKKHTFIGRTLQSKLILLPVIPPAPSGIPVASTASVVISGNVFFNGTYARVPQGTQIMVTYGGDPDTFFLNGGTYLYRRPNSLFESSSSDDRNILCPPGSSIKSTNFGSDEVGTPYSTWTLIFVYFDSEYNAWFAGTTFTNVSTDPTTIPTSGWTGGITITAA
jgi:hypothetical protein